MAKGTVNNQGHKSWGQYYFAGRRQNARKSWILEMIYTLNQSIPSFNELFDQQCTVRYFLNNYDCVVQAPTGSGKSLAYILPTLQIISQKRTKFNEQNKCEIYALIVVPSRELVMQINDLLKPICETLEFKILRLIGGVKIKPENFFKGQCVLIATPGCLEHWSEKLPPLKNYLKTLLVLILDEADRYSDMEFRKSMTSFLSLLPKQRRTGLFSATQAKNVEEFMKFGLRNPIRLNVSSDKNTKVTESLESEENSTDSTNRTKTNDMVSPAELANYYALANADKKFLALVNLLKSIPDTKVLLFLCSGAGVEYFSQILPELLETTEKGEKRPILALHRKLEKKKRIKILEQFRKSRHSILLSTDLMARGLDLVDINWVIQYDIPKYSSMFIHRSGRTARIGKEGKSLILLTKEETGYVEFIQNHENICLKEWEIEGLDLDSARNLRAKVQELAISNRSILENGTKAFVSFVEAYCKHDCNIVCRLNDLNIVGIAHSFGILRMPQMPELRKCGQNLHDAFEGRYDVNTSQIPFKNEKAEQRRQLMLKARRESGVIEEPKKYDNRQELKGDDEEKSKKRKKKMNEWDEFRQSANLLKKFKKGKMNKNELEELI